MMKSKDTQPSRNMSAQVPTSGLFQQADRFQHSNDTCSCFEMADASIPLLLLGFVSGILVTKYARQLSGKKDRLNDSTNKVTVKHVSQTLKVKSIEEEEYQVLTGAVSLFADKFSPEARQFSLNEKDGNTKKVVNYLSPQKMLKLLFSEEPNNEKDSSKTFENSTLSLNHEIGSQGKENKMVELLKDVQKYSVDTDHPYFFNQLFGALDPIAVSAELIALSVNTSAYTYETAPVFTLIERHVIKKLAQLVYPTIDLEKNGHDGLMLPGGSLSNLTALHVARHVCQSRLSLQKLQEESHFGEVHQEEKKDHVGDSKTNFFLEDDKPTLVAFVSAEAHYSFAKSVSVAGIGSENIVTVPTLPNGQMDVDQLDMLMLEMEEEDDNRIPFFVGVTAGSTVRGSFDDIEAIVQVCRKHEDSYSARGSQQNGVTAGHKIWVHVDGAWGGSAIFSARKDLRQALNGVSIADSFTFNPHKMLGAPQQTTAFVTRHEGVLQASNSSNAKYLFDKRKNGADFDLGDASYTCGRKTDAIKLWAMWKYYGTQGLAEKVEAKVDALAVFAQKIKQHDHFMLACEPCPFNINFFYLSKKMRNILKERNVDINSNSAVVPEDLANDLAHVHVELKRRLHESGEMLIPFQPLSNQKADCFRIVLAGNKRFDESDMNNVLGLLDRNGSDL